MSDPSAVVSCIQGAELGAVHEDGSFDGTLVVKFGALRVKFAALVSVELAEAEQEGRLSARGRDGQGATRFNGGATFRVAPDKDPDHSLVAMSGEVHLNGKLASLIESGAGAVVSRMTKEFSAALIERCSPAPAGTAIPEHAGQAAVAAPAATKNGQATTNRAALGGLLSRLRNLWTRLLRRRGAAPESPSAAVQSFHVEEATRGSAKAE